MANNVYIGNRYVPLFDGDWVNNKTYEPLTIVTYGNNSYTSKKPVPLNTPPTGQTSDPYWALTGNYNGQISAINQRIDDLVDGLKYDSIYFDVRKFGAKGDGVTDDTAAINSAISYINSHFAKGAVLYFPGGVYKVTSTLQFRYNGDLGGISIIGDSQYSSIIEASGDFDLISYAGDPTVPDYDGYLEGIRIENIYLKYYGGNSTKAAVDIRYANFVCMTNVRIRYFKTGVYLAAVGNSTFKDVNITANVSGAHGFDVGERSVSNLYISCIFVASGDAHSSSNNSAGFYAARGDVSDQNIYYFDVGGGTFAVYIDGANNGTPQTGDINIVGLVCESYYGIMLKNFNNHGNFNVIGGWFNCVAASPKNGIEVSDSECVNISDVVFVNNVASGTLSGLKCAIKLNNNCKYVKITGCIIRNQMALTNNGSGCESITFSNNKIVISSGVTSPDTNVAINAPHSSVIGNTWNGVVLRCVRMFTAAIHSLVCFNIATGEATGTAFQNDAGSSTTFSNNINA